MPIHDLARVRILESATALFAQRGFAGAATRDIATAAGVNQGLIAYHFGSKEALFREVVQQGLRELSSALAGAPQDLEVRLGVLASRGPLLQVLVHALLEPGPRRDWLMAELKGAGSVLRALALSEPSDDPVWLVTVATCAAAVGLFAPALQAALGRPLDPQRAVRMQRDVLLRAIQPEPLASRGPWAPRPAR